MPMRLDSIVPLSEDNNGLDEWWPGVEDSNSELDDSVLEERFIGGSSAIFGDK